MPQATGRIAIEINGLLLYKIESLKFIVIGWCYKLILWVLIFSHTTVLNSILFQGCIISEILDNNNQPINILIYI